MAGGAAAEAGNLAMGTLRPLFSGMRTHGRQLLACADDPAAELMACADDPAAELMALVWGPRFDREHARDLAQTLAPRHVDLDRVVAQAADTFDRLPARRQQRLRQAIPHRAGGTIRA